MNIAVCDDEQMYIDVVADHLKFFSVQNCIDFDITIFTSPKDLLDSDTKFDIAILDVEMDELSGLTVGEELRKKFPHIVLMYITAHKKYLDDALNLNAVRFFEKPLDSERFYRGLGDAIKRIDNSTIGFYLRDDSNYMRVALQDIVYVEIDKRMTKIVTSDGEEYYSDQNMTFWHDRLVGSMFVIPHKSYLINLNYVTSFDRSHVILCEKYKVSVARSRQSEFYRKLMKFMEEN